MSSMQPWLLTTRSSYGFVSHINWLQGQISYFWYDFWGQMKGRHIFQFAKTTVHLVFFYLIFCILNWIQRVRGMTVQALIKVLIVECIYAKMFKSLYIKLNTEGWGFVFDHSTSSWIYKCKNDYLTKSFFVSRKPLKYVNSIIKQVSHH